MHGRSHPWANALGWLPETASQTGGPYVHIGCVPSFAGLEGMYGGRDLGAACRRDGHVGEAITVEGHVFDGTGAPLRDALLELWQADANGRFAGEDGSDPAFDGWGRQPTDGETGLYRFETVRPGRVAWPDGRMQAPHIGLWIVARGINVGLYTRVYFEGDPANEEDPLLARVEHGERRATLMARAGEDGVWRFDIHLQGPKETVFFDV
ncbi:protocatechuate 3,4-dioxygenase subunit alpha [uncultured Jannaschia sp.]|uniref:protocatechuate 3,4-dioxygenase subunit alpha n=1 Tax=uncultured Jannaschia sp. TaxID=293347 RepID=UPI002635821A|nr:protocatechuate 3,4-dioxygenase subunit alpha [uncultured Jannaschia sp.]